jgi:branched-chain amino acid transport system substrate-binding protein
VGRVTAIVCLAALALAGCRGGGGGGDSHRISGDVGTVYSSIPRHGVSATAARAVLAGERRALADRHGRAGGLRIRLRELPATDDAQRPWEPDLVAENAHRAADDPSAIAYLGELDFDATAVSLPITNDAGLLQVSPGDGLASLTARGARAGERYYPTGTRSFVRVGPSDSAEAKLLVARAEAAGAKRVALVSDREIYGRELAAEVTAEARRAGLEPVASEEYRGRLAEIPDVVRALSDGRTDAVVLLGVAGADTAPFLIALRKRLPGVPVYAASGLLADPRLVLPRDAARVEAVAPRLSPERAGYRAMSLVLSAVAEGGRDRRRVIAAARRLGRSGRFELRFSPR